MDICKMCLLFETTNNIFLNKIESFPLKCIFKSFLGKFKCLEIWNLNKYISKYDIPLKYESVDILCD